MKNLINTLPDKQPEYRFTGNLFRRFPYLLECSPLPENSRQRFTLTPIQVSWYFVTPEGEVFNFYPIFLKLSDKTGIEYERRSYILNLIQAANLHNNNFIKY